MKMHEPFREKEAREEAMEIERRRNDARVSVGDAFRETTREEGRETSQK
jgi:hypothetical protein